MSRLVVIFFFCIFAALFWAVALPQIGDAKKIKDFEEIAKYDRINRDFIWPDHVGFYTNEENKLCSDICLALLYSGRVKKVTVHQFSGSEIKKSDRFWLEKRNVCPDPSKIFHQSYAYELRWVSDFNAKQGTCLMMGMADSLAEPMQVIWKRASSFPHEDVRVSRLTVLSSGSGLDLHPNESDILAQRTTIRYRNTPRLGLSMYSLVGYDSLEARFVSERIHEPYTGTGYDISHYPRAGIKPYNALRYITNLGRDGLETYKFDDQRRYFDSLEGFVPAREDLITNISEQFSALRRSDFPLNDKYNLFLHIVDLRGRQFPSNDKAALQNANQKLYDAMIHGATLELEYLTPKLNFDALNSKNLFIRHAGNISRKSTRKSSYYSAYKKAVISFTKSVNERNYIISKDNLPYYHYEGAKYALTNFSRILAYDEFDEELANIALDIAIRHDSETFEIIKVLERTQWKNTKAVDKILTKIEEGKLSEFGIRDNLNILSYMSQDSLGPHKVRIAAIINSNPIKSSRTRERFQKELGL